tara:strand:- start:12207 stop:12635 length:429 start_codon:yes stop_codon:yes gene_type:complete
MEFKIGKSSKGELMHYSVGALIEKDGKYLLIDRAIEPEGFACIAGHVDDGEEIEDALIREVREESGLDVKSKKLILEIELEDNWCVKGATNHYWYVFRCDVSGRTKKKDDEVKSIGWYSKKEIKDLGLEPSWEILLEKIGVI